MLAKKNYLLILYCLTLLQTSALCEERPRIAILPLDRKNIVEVEALLVTRLIFNQFVATRQYVVLDRDFVKKILDEQYLGNVGVVSEDKAGAVGELLKVEAIVTGSVMMVQGSYFIELRRINVVTSTVDKSETCSALSIDELGQKIPDLVARMGEFEPQKIVAQPMTKTLLDPIDSSELKAAIKLPTAWESAGLSCFDFMEFTESEKSLAQWAQKQYRTPSTAAMLGTIPLFSGFYYTGDYGLALFVSFAKIFLIGAGIQHELKGGETIFSPLVCGLAYGSVTAVDMMTSSLSASLRNNQWKILLEAQTPHTGQYISTPALKLSYTF